MKLSSTDYKFKHPVYKTADLCRPCVHTTHVMEVSQEKIVLGPVRRYTREVTENCLGHFQMGSPKARTAIVIKCAGEMDPPNHLGPFCPGLHFALASKSTEK